MQSHDLVGCDIGGPVQMEFSSLVDLDNKESIKEHLGRGALTGKKLRAGTRS